LTSSLLSFFQGSSRKRKQGGPEVADVILSKTTSSASSGKTSFPAGSKLLPEWSLGLVKINMTALGFSTIGPVTIHDLCKPRPNDPFPSDVGAGSMFGSGVPIPTTNDGDSKEAIIKKWTDYGDQVQAERFVIRNAVEDLLAGFMPFPFAFPSPIELGPFALKVSNNPSSSSCTAIAHWIETGRLEKRKGSCGPLGQLLSEASKSLERIRAKANDKHWPVPSGAVGMIGPAGKNMDGAILLKQLRMLNPNLPITAEMCGVTGGAGQNIDASILLKRLRKLYPDLIVTAEMCGMTGGAGQNMDASITLQEYRALDPDLIVTAEMCGMTGGAGQNMDASITLQEYRALDPDLVITAEMVNMTGAPGRSMDASNVLHARRRESPDEVFSAEDVGMPGATGLTMNASIKLSDLRRLFPGRDFSAAEVGMPGGAGRNIDASIKLRDLRDLYPDLIVTAEMCGMTGATGIAMDAALHNADLPLMRREPSQYTGFPRKNLKEQQAQHRNLIAQGVHFYVDGKARTPCQAHLELELKLKSLNTREPSTTASFSLQKAYERMGEKGNLRLVKVCSKHATSTSPGVKGFDIYAYFPPPALSSVQSASSSIGSNVVQEPVRPSAFSLLKPSTGAPLKRTVGHVRNDNAKCPWPGCTHPPFSLTTDMKRHFNSHTEGSTEVKRGGASHKKNLKK